MTDKQSQAEIFGSDRMWGLKELPLPDPVSWWPQTPGWYLLGTLILAGLCYLAWRLWLRYRHDAYRRQGLVRLDEMTTDPAALKELPLLLKKSALMAGARQQVASLQGHAWIAWLNETAGDDLFSTSDADTLELLAYAQPGRALPDTTKAAHLIEASKSWMRMHRATV